MHCQVPGIDHFLMSKVAIHATLESANALAVSHNGILYIAESDEKKINRVRQVSTNGEISLVAGAPSGCDCKNDAMSVSRSASRVEFPVRFGQSNRSVCHFDSCQADTTCFFVHCYCYLIGFLQIWSDTMRLKKLSLPIPCAIFTFYHWIKVLRNVWYSEWSLLIILVRTDKLTAILKIWRLSLQQNLKNFDMSFFLGWYLCVYIG